MKLWNKSWCYNKKIIEKIESKINPINPDIKFIKFWNIFLVLLSFLNFFILSVEMCFFSGEYDHKIFSAYSFISTIKLLNLICYGFDIILNFLTGYHNGGTLIMNLKIIRKQYSSNLFYLDMFAYIPNFIYLFEDVLYQLSNKYCIINILFFFILKKYNLRLKDFKEFLIQEEEAFENWFSIAVLYLRTLLISHILACCWYLVGTYYNTRTTWVSVYNSIENDWESKYINSLYWSMVTMVSVGYGDIVPQNDIEKVFCIATMLIGFTVFGFTLGSFGDIIQKMNKKNQDLK